MASLAQMLSCRAFYWGSAANAFLQPHHRVKLASDQEIFTVKLLTIANYPPFLCVRGGFARKRYI